MKLERRKFKSGIGNYKQQNLESKIFGKEYDARSATADVRSLPELLSNLRVSETDVFSFKVTVLSRSFPPLFRGSQIHRPVARRLAQS